MSQTFGSNWLEDDRWSILVLINLLTWALVWEALIEFFIKPGESLGSLHTWTMAKGKYRWCTLWQMMAAARTRNGFCRFVLTLSAPLTHWALLSFCLLHDIKQEKEQNLQQSGKESLKMVGEAKPMLATLLDYYNHVMIDLRDPRFMNVNDLLLKSLHNIVRQ